MLEQDPGEQLSRAQRTSDMPGGAAASLASGAAEDREWVEAQLSRLELLLCTVPDPTRLAPLLMRELAPMVGAARGAIYTRRAGSGVEGTRLVLCASYAAGAELPESIAPGEGLVGQCALEQRKLVLRDVPAEHFRVQSALGASTPHALVLLPVWLGEGSLAVIELGFFGELTAPREALLDRLSLRRAGAAFGTPVGAAVGTAVGTEFGAVANPSSAPAEGEAAAAGAEPASAVLSRPQPPSRRSGFWGKLSHELRSPLNSVLVLSKLLSDNAEDNLTSNQVAFARAIHASGNDLLGLVNAISDLSKIETNRLVLELTEMPFDNFRAHLERAFEPVARGRDLEFGVELARGLPASIVSDAKRLRQIMKCLLSNAFKFTEQGRVSVKVAVCTSGWSPERERLNSAPEVVAFSVTDTGVGMSESEQRSILDVFPPEHIESRRGAGASGLGMAISRELARLLGGELRVDSVVGGGSTFTLYLPSRGQGLAGSRVEERPAEAAPPSAPISTRSPSTLSPSTPPPSMPGAELGSRRTRKRRDPGEAPRSPELAGVSLLLVDDDVRSAFAMTGLLERQGASVSHAEDMDEALERLAVGPRVSALLIDAELLRSGPAHAAQGLLQRCSGLPIVALAGAPRPAPRAPSADRAATAPCSPLGLPSQVHQLAKPIDPRQLASVLRAGAAGVAPACAVPPEPSVDRVDPLRSRAT